jgi:predicted small secreted protein
MIHRTPAVLLAAGLALGGLAGCNTVEGAGADISAAGNWVANAFDSSDRDSRPATTAAPAAPSGTSATSGPTRVSPSPANPRY